MSVSVVTIGKKNSKTKEGSTTVFRTKSNFGLSRAQVSIGLILRTITLLPSHEAVLVNTPSIHMLPTALFARLFRKKLLVFHQGDLILPDAIVNRCIQSVYDIMMYLTCRLAHKVATYSHDYATHSRVLCPHMKKITSIILPITKPQIMRSKDEPEWYVQLKKRKKEQGLIIAGFAGRMVSEKGFDTLARAIDRLSNTEPALLSRLHFVYAGAQMPYEDYFQSIKPLLLPIQKHITQTGLLNSDQLPYFYDIIDFFILPSRSECFGLVQAEAALVDKPLVVNNIPGARTLVQRADCGILFETNSVIDLGRAISQMSKTYRSYNTARAVDKVLNESLIKKDILSFLLD